MKRKKILLIFTLLVVFVGIKSIKATEYKLKSSSNNPVICVYHMSDDSSIKISLLYKNDEITAYHGVYSVDGGNAKMEKADIKIKQINTAKACPSKLDYDYNNGQITIKALNKKVHCGTGEGALTAIPSKVPELTSLIVTIIQIAVPIVLILMGSIDLFKGITAGKEDEMKKGQQLFIKRLVVGAIIFFIVVIAKFLISIVADTNVSNIVSCVDCFIDNKCTEGYE